MPTTKPTPDELRVSFARNLTQQMAAFAEREGVTRHRAILKLSYEDGLDQSRLYAWMRGDGLPTLLHFMTLCHRFDVEPGDMFK